MQATLDRISPQRAGVNWVNRALVFAGLRVQELASSKYIKRGGRVRVAGPKGGKGKLTSAGPISGKLTSRNGGAGLVGSIRVDRGGLPLFVDIGSDRIYAAVHELGFSGTVRVSAHTRTSAFGRKTKKAFTVPAHSRKMKMPKRPYLAPALEDASKDFSAIFVKELDKELGR